MCAKTIPHNRLRRPQSTRRGSWVRVMRFQIEGGGALARPACGERTLGLVNDAPAEAVINIECIGTTPDGKAIYPVEVLTLKKDLEERGQSVVFDHPAEQRTYKRMHSSEAEMMMNFGISLGASGIVAAIQSLAGLGGDRKVTIRAKRSAKAGEDHIEEEFEYIGPASGAPEVIKAWRRQEGYEPAE